MAPWCIYISCIERVARCGSGRGVVGTMNAARSRPDWLATVQSGRKQVQSRVCTPGLKPGVHTNDFAPIYGRRAKKLGHASLVTVFRHGRLKFQPIIWENLESPVLRYQPITTAVITDACLNTRWHHGAYTSAVLREPLVLDRVMTVCAELSRPDWLATVQSGRKQAQSRVCTPGFRFM